MQGLLATDQVQSIPARAVQIIWMQPGVQEVETSIYKQLLVAA